MHEYGDICKEECNEETEEAAEEIEEPVISNYSEIVNQIKQLALFTI